MIRTTSPILRIGGTCAALGFLVGLVLAVSELSGAAQVLEFQAKGGTSSSQRWVAIAQRATIEGLGFGSLGLLLAAIATRLGRVAPLPGAFFLCAAAAGVWIGPGTWFGELALPFLDNVPILLLDIAGFAACLVVLVVLHLLTRLLPWAPRAAPVGACLASGLGFVLVALWARETLALGSAGRTTGRLAVGAGLALAAFALAPLAARAFEPLYQALSKVFQSRPTRGLVRGMGAALSVATIVTLATLQVSGVVAKKAPTALESTAPAGPNVVLVTLDTLRADHLGCYGYERPTSPFLDTLAAAGTRFDQPVAAAGWTKPATGTILTGLYPSRHGALYHGSSLQVPEGGRTLAEAFRDAGFATAGFVTNPNIKKVFDFDRGFDEYFDSPVEDTVTLAAIRGSLFGQALMRLARHQFNWKYENDVRQMNRHIAPWIRRNKDQRFFLYLHYIDPHIPYDPPQPYRADFAQDHGMALFKERKEKVGRDLYDGEIRYSDEGLKEIVAVMQEAGIWENTIFAFTSDHGEEFFEHGVLGHGFSLYEPVVRVPLLFHGPGVARDRVVEAPAQIVDLGATLLDLADTGVQSLGDGSSFAAAMRDETWNPAEPYFLENEFGQSHDDNRSFVFSGVRQGPWKLVLTEENEFFPPEKFGAEALYNLEEDPEELVNLIHEVRYRDRIESMLTALRSHAAFLQAEGFRDVAPASLSAELEESLRALGYL